MHHAGLEVNVANAVKDLCTRHGFVRVGGPSAQSRDHFILELPPVSSQRKEVDEVADLEKVSPQLMHGFTLTQYAGHGHPATTAMAATLNPKPYQPCENLQV